MTSIDVEAGVGRVSRTVDAPVHAVWSVLANGWDYANWVVGTSRIRDVDPGWPAAGSKVHHSFGAWRLLINDTTRVESMRENEELVLTARGWPLGQARVVVTLRSDSPARCTVAIAEDAVTGPGRFVPRAARQALIVPRNREALKRLGFIAVGRHRGAAQP